MPLWTIVWISGGSAARARAAQTSSHTLGDFPLVVDASGCALAADLGYRVFSARLFEVKRVTVS